MLKYPAFIIILCAGFGFFATYLILRTNIAQNPVDEIEILVAQDTSKMHTIYDTIKAKTKFYQFPPKVGVKGDQPNDSTQKKLEYKALIFNQNSKYLVWMFVFSLMSGYAFAFLPILVQRVKGDFRHMRIKIKELIVALSVCLVILLALVIGSGDSDNLLSILDINELTKALFQNEMVLKVLISINIIIGMLAFAGQLLIGIAIPKLSKDFGKSTLTSTLKDFNRYEESLKFYLSFLAGMISFSVITSSYLRKSLLAAVDAGSFDLFPIEFIFAYGMSFTVILAIFYLPIYYQLRLKGVELNSKYSALFASDEGELPSDEDFLIKENGISNLKVALSILAPVLTSILGDIINL